MGIRSILFRCSLVLNIMGCIAFAGFVFYNVFFIKKSVEENDWLAMLFLSLCLTVYFISDFSGLHLVKLYRQQLYLSGRKRTGIIMVTCLQLLLQAALVYIIYDGINTMRTLQKGTELFMIYKTMLLFLSILFVVLMTAFYNIIENFYFTWKVKSVYKQMNEIIEDIGAGL